MHAGGYAGRRHALVALLALACLATLAALPGHARADEQKKQPSPAVVRYAIADDPLDRSTWRDADDAAQGERIGFAVVGSLPKDVDLMRGFSYWLVAEPSAGLTYVERSATAWLVSANGARDVTDVLDVGPDGTSVVAGAPDLAAAIPNVSDTDELVLFYEATLNKQAACGFGTGNVSHAHAEHSPTATSNAVSSAAVQPQALHAASDERADARKGLSRTDELLTTVFTYRIVVRKQDEHGAALAGARLALRDASGAWYVHGAGWSANKDDAFVVTTNDRGVASFKGVDSKRYEVVELAAPDGYALAKPVDVTLEADPQGGGRTLAASSKTGGVESVDAEGGVVTLRMVDRSLAVGSITAPTAAGTQPTAATPQSAPVPATRHPQPQALSSTRDPVIPMAPLVAASATLALAGLALRRPRGLDIRTANTGRRGARHKR